jgi:hypothetical protein
MEVLLLHELEVFGQIVSDLFLFGIGHGSS